MYIYKFSIVDAKFIISNNFISISIERKPCNVNISKIKPQPFHSTHNFLAPKMSKPHLFLLSVPAPIL